MIDAGASSYQIDNTGLLLRIRERWWRIVDIQFRECLVEINLDVLHLYPVQRAQYTLVSGSGAMVASSLLQNTNEPIVRPEPPTARLQVENQPRRPGQRRRFAFRVFRIFRG